MNKKITFLLLGILLITSCANNLNSSLNSDNSDSITTSSENTSEILAWNGSESVRYSAFTLVNLVVPHQRV